MGGGSVQAAGICGRDCSDGGGSGQLIQVRVGVGYHPQSSPSASTRKKSLIAPLVIFSLEMVIIKSKIFISAKKERPGKGCQ